MRGPSIGLAPYRALDTYLHHKGTGKRMESKHPREHLWVERHLVWTLDENMMLNTESANGISIRYHATRIVTYTDDNVCFLNNGGWDSSTTRERLREFMPSGTSLLTEGGKWYIGFGSTEQTMLVRHRKNEWVQTDNGSWYRTDAPMEFHEWTTQYPVMILPFDESMTLRLTDVGWAPADASLKRAMEMMAKPMPQVTEDGRTKVVMERIDKYMRRIVTGHINYDATCASCIAGLEGNEHIFEHLLACEAPPQMVQDAMIEYGYPREVKVRGISLMKHTMSNALRRYFITHLLEEQ